MLMFSPGLPHFAGPITTKGNQVMLRWALAFAVLALVAGLLGFVGLQGDFAYVAKILLFVFIVLFVVSLIFGRGSPAV
jgi:uncharacterized membrane protein YtjA (UPF0391 family)